MAIIRVDRVVDAPAEAAWDVLGDPAAIAEYAGNLSETTVDGEGEGMQRRCWDTSGNHWDETCRVWEPGERYAFEVHTGESGSLLHRPFATFVGSFGVDDGDETVIWAAFEVEPRWGPLGTALVAVLRPLFRRGTRDLLDAWAADIEGSAGGGGAS